MNWPNTIRHDNLWEKLRKAGLDDRAKKNMKLDNPYGKQQKYCQSVAFLQSVSHMAT